MSEQKKKVETYRIDMLCDYCGVGYMRPTGVVFTSYPAIYEHKCSVCGVKQKYQHTYPYTETREVEK